MEQRRYPMECFGEGRVRVGGRFKPNGSSAISAAASQGTSGWTVAYTSTGLYTLTYTGKFQYLFDRTLSLGMGTAADGSLQWGETDLDARTVQIRHLLAGSLADIAASTHNYIDFGFTGQRLASALRR